MRKIPVPVARSSIVGTQVSVPLCYRYRYLRSTYVTEEYTFSHFWMLVSELQVTCNLRIPYGRSDYIQTLLDGGLRVVGYRYRYVKYIPVARL